MKITTIEVIPISSPLKRATDYIAVKVPRIVNGFFYPADTPGIGVELKEDRIKEIITRGMEAVAINT